MTQSSEYSSDRYAEFIQPVDEYNRDLIANVHPLDWVNPQPAALYDLVVIGAGTAGLVVAAGAAGVGVGFKGELIETNPTAVSYKTLTPRTNTCGDTTGCSG